MNRPFRPIRRLARALAALATAPLTATSAAPAAFAKPVPPPGGGATVPPPLVHTARRLLVLFAALMAVSVPWAAIAAPHSGNPAAFRLVTGLQGGLGSTVGPDGALYVTEPAAGRVTRVDPQTGATTTYADGLPKPVIGLGGATDIAFLGHTAYVLVTLVSPDVGGSDIDGIYRVDGPHRFTVVADIGQFATGHPPATPFEVPSGLQFALQPYRGGFLVTDGHHNRVYRVPLDGTVTQLLAFGNIVPTGLAVRGGTIYMAEAGPVPHLPENGRVVSFGPRPATAVTQLASGSPLLVDVEVGRGRTLYALSQGIGSGGPPGSPALPDTGALVKVNGDGTFTPVITGLDRPTSLEFIGTTAYVVTLGGEIWKIDGVSGPPYGAAR